MIIPVRCFTCGKVLTFSERRVLKEALFLIGHCRQVGRIFEAFEGREASKVISHRLENIR